jgi:hypothetical protein
VPNRQARADGKVVAIDGTSLYYEAKAVGVIYQATLWRELNRSIGLEFASAHLETADRPGRGLQLNNDNAAAGDPPTGMRRRGLGGSDRPSRTSSRQILSRGPSLMPP